jgi:hypothetical protein
MPVVLQVYRRCGRDVCRFYNNELVIDTKMAYILRKLNTRYLRLPQKCSWGFGYSRVWHCFAGLVFADGSNERNNFIAKVSGSSVNKGPADSTAWGRGKTHRFLKFIVVFRFHFCSYNRRHFCGCVLWELGITSLVITGGRGGYLRYWVQGTPQWHRVTS